MPPKDTQYHEVQEQPNMAAPAIKADYGRTTTGVNVRRKRYWSMQQRTHSPTQAEGWLRDCSEIPSVSVLREADPQR
jgi:hypothetical protein